MFNLIVGTGALTMPRAFATAGWVVSVSLITFLAFMRYVFIISLMLKRIITGERVILPKQCLTLYRHNLAPVVEKQAALNIIGMSYYVLC